MAARVFAGHRRMNRFQPEGMSRMVECHVATMMPELPTQSSRPDLIAFNAPADGAVAQGHIGPDDPTDNAGDN